MTSEELCKVLCPSKTESMTAQVLCDGLNINKSSFFTTLIKEAARCNDYSSDVFYDLNIINDAFSNYRYGKPFEPIWIGFRRYGVDGTDFVLERCGNPFELHKTYFALYSVVVKPDEPGWCNVYFNQYGM